MQKHNWFRDLCIAALFAVLPVQTQYVFAVPVLAGAAWEHGVVRLYLLDALVLVMAAWCIRDRMYMAMSRRTRWLLVAGMAVFACWTLVPAVGNLRSWLLLVHVMSALAVLLVARYARRENVLTGFFLGGVGVAIVGIVQYLMQRAPGTVLLGMSSHAPHVLGDAVVLVHGERVLRAYGVVPHPNMFGGYLVMALATGVLLYARASARARRWLIMGTILSLIALLWTYSRSAWVGALVLAVIAAAVYRRARISVPGGAVILLMSTVIITLLYSRGAVGVRVGVPQTNPLELRSLQERVASWREGMYVWRDHWLLGTGFGRYTDALQQRVPGLPGYAYQPTHNVYLLLLCEFGLLGMILLVACLVLLLRHAAWYWLVPLGVMGLFDYYWVAPGVGLLLAGYWIGISGRFFLAEKQS